MSKISLSLSVIFGVFALAFAQSTVTGTTITNQATVYYRDSAAGTQQSVNSNTVTTVVQTVYDIEVTPNSSTASATAATDFSSYTRDGLNEALGQQLGSTVQFDYLVTNNTNTDATSTDPAERDVDVALTVVQDGVGDAFDFTSYSVYLDTDKDGIIDTDATGARTGLLFSSSTGASASGSTTFSAGQAETQNIIIEAALPTTATSAQAGGSAYLELSASAYTGGTVTPVQDVDNNNFSEASLVSVDLSTTITADNANPAIGDAVSFTVTTSNAAGSDTATGVDTTVTIPDGFTVGAITDGAGGVLVEGTDYTVTVNPDGSSSIVFLNDTIAAGGSTGYQIATTVDATLNDGTTTTAGQAPSPAASVTAADQPDSSSALGDGTGNDYDTEPMAIQSADLAIVKTAQDSTGATVTGPVVGGATFNYVITVTNAGPNAASGVVVTDVLPAGISLNASIADASSTDASDTVSYDATSRTVTWTLGSLLAGDDPATTAVVETNNDTLTLPVVVDSGFSGAIDNTASVSQSGPGEPFNQTGADSDAYNLNSASPDLAMSDSLTYGGTTSSDPASPVAVNVGDSLFYNVTVTNQSSVAASGVEARVVLPAGVSYVGSSQGATALSPAQTTDASGRTVLVYSLAGVAGNSSLTTIDVETTVNDSFASQTLGFYSEISAITEGDVDSSPESDLEVDAATPSYVFEDDEATEAVYVKNVDVSLSETVYLADGVTTVGTTKVNPGDSLVYKVVVSNAGPDAATLVDVEQLLPAGVGFTLTDVSTSASAGSTAGTVSVTGQTVSYADATIASGGSVTYTVSVSVADADLDNAGGLDAGFDTTMDSSAQVSAAAEYDIDSTPNNAATLNEDDNAGNVVTMAVIDLSITGYTVTPTTGLLAGDTVNYSFDIGNALGSDTATGVGIADLLPAEVTYSTGSMTITDSLGNPVAFSYDATSDTLTFTDPLPAGETFSVSYAATLDAVYTNNEGGNGNLDYSTVSHSIEISAADQIDSDSTPGNGVATEDDIATASFTPSDAVIGAAKRLVSASNPPDGSQPASSTNPFTVVLEFVVENLGNVTLSNVQLTDNLDAAFGVGNYAVTAVGPATNTGGGTVTSNGAFNGSSNQNLYAAGGALPAAATTTMQITVDIYGKGNYTNSATATATDSNGNTVSDNSTDGNDPDPGADGDPSPDGTDTAIDLDPISLTKTQSICSDSDGTAGLNTATDTCGVATTAQQNVDPGQYIVYTITASNNRTTSVYDVQVVDSLPANTEHYDLNVVPSGFTGAVLYWNGLNWSATEPVLASGDSFTVGVDTNADGLVDGSDVVPASGSIAVTFIVRVP